MAKVYRAFDPEIDRAVAIKVLKPEFARDPEIGARFLREARAAGALSHANIATIYDVGEAQGIAYIAMELIEGQPLDRVIQQGRIPFERVLHIGRQLASALAYAHRAGVVHRDIKPSNILLSEEGRVAKVLDFGVARIGDGDVGGKGLDQTRAGQLIGTPRYMSPEQALGLPVGPRADLFSLGVVLYEMVTGKVAFPGTALATLAIKIAQERVEPIDRSIADCPPGLRFIIDKLLAKKPEHRFADGDALERAVARELAMLDETNGPRRGLSLRIKLPLALALVTAAALIACTLTMLSHERRTLEHMAVMSGESITAFVSNNAAIMVADNAGLPPGEQDWAPLQAFAAAAARDPAVRDLLIVDQQGVVRAAGDERKVGLRYRSASGEGSMPSTGTSRVTTAEDTGRGGGIRFVRPITYAGARFGSVDMVMRRTALDAAIETSRNALLALSAVVMLAVLFVGYLSGAQVAKPLGRLRRALDEAGQLGFALRISHRRGDEFGAAFDAFNRAAAAVEPRLAADGNDSGAMLVTRVSSTKLAG